MTTNSDGDDDDNKANDNNDDDITNYDLWTILLYNDYQYILFGNPTKMEMKISANVLMVDGFWWQRCLPNQFA